MSWPWYVALAIALSGALTFALRALPLLARSRLRDSWVMDELSRYLPLGAIMILLVYCIAGADYTRAVSAIPTLLGIATTAVTHWRWRQAGVSMIVGTGTCVAFTILLQ